MKNKLMTFIPYLLLALCCFPVTGVGQGESATTSHEIIPASPLTADTLTQSYMNVEVEENYSDSIQHELDWGLDVMPFVRHTKFADQPETLNPDNRVALLDEFDGGLYIRPSFTYRLRKDDDILRVWAKPRFNFNTGNDEGNIFDEDDYSLDFFFQELKAKWQINQNLYLLAGRYLKEMGSSIFINPSNPFLPNPGRLNPKLEQKPMDFVELNYSFQNNWNFSLIANLHEADNPSYEFPFFDFKRNYGLLGEYYGASENLGLLVSIDENEKYHLGTYGQKNITEALLVWMDAALEYNTDRFYPVTGHWTEPRLLDYDMIDGEANKELFATALLGASYTTRLGPTVQVEYLYNGKGYNDDEASLFYEMIASSSRYNFDITKDLANINMARAINPGMPYIRRHYLFTQVGENDLFGALNYNLRYIYSFEDQSSQFSSLIEWNLNNIELYSVLQFNFGDRETDLKRLIDHQLMFGLIYRL